MGVGPDEPRRETVRPGVCSAFPGRARGPIDPMGRGRAQLDWRVRIVVTEDPLDPSRADDEPVDPDQDGAAGLETVADGDHDDGTAETAFENDPETRPRDPDRSHLSDLPDGAGCAEIWEHLSERRRTDEGDE